MKTRFAVFFIIIVFPLFFSSLSADEFKVAVKELGPITDHFVKVVTAVIEATGNKAVIQRVPPARADYLISSKTVDVQYPIIVITDPAKVKNLQYDFSTVKLYSIAFVLYTNKNKPFDVNSIRKENPKKYNLEADPSRLEDFNYPVSASQNFEWSMQKVNDGKIDGFVVSQTIGDPIIKKLNAKNIRRQLWNEYEEAFSIQKGTIGGRVDKMLSEGVAKLRASGKLQELIGDFAKTSKYSNWQP